MLLCVARQRAIHVASYSQLHGASQRGRKEIKSEGAKSSLSMVLASLRGSGGMLPWKIFMILICRDAI